MVKKNGINFVVETGAGLESAIIDQAYIDSGAKIVTTK